MVDHDAGSLRLMSTAAIGVEAADRDEDRAGAFGVAGARVLVVADGAGGRAGGRETALAIVNAVERGAAELARGEDPRAIAEALGALDAELARRPAGGESTCVVAVLRAGAVWGASVGDSVAWLLRPGGQRDLTRDQVRMPMLGSGAAIPVAFGPAPLRPGERLLLATDGLWKYTSAERILEAGLGGPVDRAARTLIECVRLPSGALQDDVAVVLVDGP